MQNEAISLSVQFFEQVKAFKKDEAGKIVTSNAYKVIVMQDIQELLSGNMTYKTLHDAINLYVSKNPEKMLETYTVSEILDYLQIKYRKDKPVERTDNLLQRNKFYFHQALQITPPAPITTQLPDGSFHTTYEPFYLEIRELFTLDDLLDYFYMRAGVVEKLTVDRDKGAFRHMLKSYDIDFLLHLIDEGVAQAQDRGMNPPTEPFSLQAFVAEAQELYECRKNTCFEGGFDHVIPRKRHE